MTTARIRAAFEAKLKTWADAQVPPIPVAWENTVFTPPAGRYARSNLIPARTTSRDLESKNRSYSGVYQVSLYLMRDKGPGEADALAASLDAAFPASDPLIAGELYVFITSPMSQAAPVPDGDRSNIPVSCEYHAEDYLA